MRSASSRPWNGLLAQVEFTAQEAAGKYVCSICGYAYDPAEHDSVVFEALRTGSPPLQEGQGEV